jgi:uncharacterized membrane protein YkvI
MLLTIIIIIICISNEQVTFSEVISNVYPL